MAWQISFTIGNAEWLLVEEMLSDIFPALTVKPVREGDPHSPQLICLIFPDEPAREALQKQLTYIFETFQFKTPDITIDKLPDIDWLQHVYEQLKPIETGRFFVHGSHIKDHIPDDKVAIIIEAATAFGTGEHPTTKGCLLAFDQLLNEAQPKNILDMGCGSGILSIAAARVLDHVSILGVDIDPNSITVSKNHARDNHVEDKMTLIAGDGFHVPDVSKRSPYDLVFANILAQPLIDFAPDLVRVASRDILLSGFTKEQTPYVEKAYTSLGCRVKCQNAIEEWVTLWLQTA